MFLILESLMRFVPTFVASVLLASVATSPSFAQNSEGDGGEIIVTGQRERGAVIGDIQPEFQLRPADIRATGATSVSELLATLAPQLDTRAGGQPIVLLNGQRISGFAEVRDLPSEAIVRVDILPPEVALKFGFTAQQRVANIVLRSNFRAVTAEAVHVFAEEGGAANPQGEVNLLRLQAKGRVTLNLKAAYRSALTEAQRDIAAITAKSPFDPKATVTDPSKFRTLLPETRDFSGNFVLNRSLGRNLVGTINTVLAYSQSNAQRGLPSASLLIPEDNPFAPGGVTTRLSGFVPGTIILRQRNESQNARIAFTLAPNAAKWRWNFTGSAERTNSTTDSDGNVDVRGLQARLDANDGSFNPFSGLVSNRVAQLSDDRARVRTDLAVLDLLITGSPFRTPAGEASLSIRAGGQVAAIDNRTFRGGVLAEVSLSRTTGSGQVNLDVPIASKANGILRALGTLSANANATVQKLSGVGSISTLGGGMVWTPAKPLDLILSYKRDEVAPSVNQLGNPRIETANVPFFDAASSQSVLVSCRTAQHDLET
jgi:iron complex outermembrane recepter protein